MKKYLCLEDQLALLRQEHRKLDQRIRNLELRPSLFEQMQIRRMKREKLRLKEDIEHLHKQLEPSQH